MQIPYSQNHTSPEIELANLARLLGGRCDGASAMCLCPAHDDRKPSLSIRIGERRLLFKCFAGCDTIDVLEAIRARGLSAALWRRNPAHQPPRKPAFDGRGAALALWQEANAVVRGAPARYLRSRALTGPWPGLRFHSHVPLGRGPDMIRRPALLAPVVDGTGFCGVQRCFLDASEPRLARDIDPPRRMLGRPGRGAVRLAAPSNCLGLAEGLETAMSAMRRFDMAVWATLGNERFGLIDIPAHVTTLVLFPDNDRAGQHGEAIARAAYRQPGREILTRWPPLHVNDWNDLAQEEGRERDGVRLAG